MYPSNRASYFSLFRFSVAFSIFLRGKTPHAKAKAVLQSPLFRGSLRAGRAPFFIGGDAMYVSFEPRRLFPLPAF